MTLSLSDILTRARDNSKLLIIAIVSFLIVLLMIIGISLSIVQNNKTSLDGGDLTDGPISDRLPAVAHPNQVTNIKSADSQALVNFQGYLKYLPLRGDPPEWRDGAYLSLMSLESVQLDTRFDPPSLMLNFDVAMLTFQFVVSNKTSPTEKHYELGQTLIHTHDGNVKRYGRVDGSPLIGFSSQINHFKCRKTLTLECGDVYHTGKVADLIIEQFEFEWQGSREDHQAGRFTLPEVNCFTA